MVVQRFYESDRSSTRFPEQINELLHDNRWVEQLWSLPEDELAKTISYLNDVWVVSSSNASCSPLPQIVDGLDHTSSSFRKGLHTLRKICSSRTILPPTYELSEKLSFQTTQIVAFGGFCDVYKGSLAGADVCVKRLRISTTGGQEAVKKVPHLYIFG